MASQFNNFRLALGCLNLGTGIVGTSFGQLIAMLGSNVSHSPEDPGVFPGWTLMATSAVLGLSGLLWLISSGIPDGKSLNVAAVASQVVAMLVTAAATTIIGIYALRYDSVAGGRSDELATAPYVAGLILTGITFLLSVIGCAWCWRSKRQWAGTNHC